MPADITTLKTLVCEAITTHVDELSCGECFERLDLYAERALRGEDMALVMPRVHDHLAHCAECREEVAALIDALRATVSGLSA